MGEFFFVYLFFDVFFVVEWCDCCLGEKERKEGKAQREPFGVFFEKEMVRLLRCLVRCLVGAGFFLKCQVKGSICWEKLGIVLGLIVPAKVGSVQPPI